VRRGVFRAALLALALALPAVAGAASTVPPKGFALRVLVRGLDEPTGFAWAPDGRIYISQKKGIVRVFDHGRLRLFLNIRKQVNEYDERGLDDIALDPHFAQNRRMYLLFTRELRPDDPDKLHPGSGTLVSLRVSKTHPDRPVPGSFRTLLTGMDVHGPWHAAAGLAFDSKGRLLAGFGDGSVYYPKDWGPAALQTYDLSVLTGKIVRIDPVTGRGVPDNPFYDPAHPDAVRSKVLAYGLRNPFSIHVDRETNVAYVGDVGTDQWEEIDVVPLSVPRGKRLNYGWPCYEGGDRTPVHQAAYAQLRACVKRFYDKEESASPTVPSIYAYPGSGGAAVVVGPIYHGKAYPSRYDGRLFFGDWAKDKLWTLHDGKASSFGTIGYGNPVDIQQTPRGTIAYLAFGLRTLNEITYIGGDSSGPSAVVWIAAGLGAAAISVAGGMLFVRRRRTSR